MNSPLCDPAERYLHMSRQPESLGTAVADGAILVAGHGNVNCKEKGKEQLGRIALAGVMGSALRSDRRRARGVESRQNEILSLRRAVQALSQNFCGRWAVRAYQKCALEGGVFRHFQEAGRPQADGRRR